MLGRPWLLRKGSIRILKRFGLAFATLLAAGGAYLAMLQLTGNFHTVIAGELYRSAQPSAADIAEYKQKAGIRTIVNLRGR